MPQISVIVPVYNVEKQIRRCIDSILAQTFTDYEVILVDDGSPDNCGNICDEYALKDNRISVIHKKNGGLSDARNAGLRIASGEYILFLDSDDHITEDCLEELSGHDADLIVGTIMWAYQNGNIIYQDERKDELILMSQYSEKLPDLLGERRLNYVHAKLYKHQIIIDNNLLFEDDMLTSAEDTVFNFSFLKYCNSLFVSGKPVHYYMQYSGGLASKFYPDRYQRFCRLNDYLVRTCKELSIYNQQMESEINKRKVMSAVWSVYGILSQCNLSSRDKVCYLNYIRDDTELKSIIPMVDTYGIDNLVYLVDKGGMRLMIHIRVNKIKGKVLKIFPGLSGKTRRSNVKV